MPEVKHCFAYRVKHYLIPRGSSGADNKEMLDGKELARLLREAMDTAKPRVSSARLAEACNVTPQAVNGWRKTGRMAKRHITTAANLTGKSIEYFLGADAGISPASTPQQELLLHLFGELMPLQRQELVKGLRALLYANQITQARKVGEEAPPWCEQRADRGPVRVRPGRRTKKACAPEPLAPLKARRLRRAGVSQHLAPVFALWLFFGNTSLADELIGVVTAVHDGDTLTLESSGLRLQIRLAEIDAPELAQGKYGQASRESLAGLCLNRPAAVEQKGRDRNERLIGRVRCAGVDANAEQVRRGMAWVYVRYTKQSSPLHALQEEALEAQRGLWADPQAVPPWEWRRRTY